MNSERRREIMARIAEVESLQEQMKELSVICGAAKVAFEMVAEAASDLQASIDEIKEAEGEALGARSDTTSESYEQSEHALQQLEEASAGLGVLAAFAPDLDLPDLDPVITALDEAKQ